MFSLTVIEKKQQQKESNISKSIEKVKLWKILRNLQQHHSSFCDTINIFTINLFVFSNLI